MKSGKKLRLESEHCFCINSLVIPLFLLLLITAFPFTKNVVAGQLDIEQRVSCQTIIEDIRWSYRIWPDENKTPKPGRAEVLSDSMIRDKVINNLRMETALAALYGVEMNTAMLQEELSRITSSTRAPEHLQELFNALSNDPVAIGECIALPVLVGKQLYDRYVHDNNLHKSVREQAEEALARSTDDTVLIASGAKKRTMIIFRRDAGAEAGSHTRQDTVSADGYNTVELEADVFASEVSRLSSASGMRETETAFIYEEIGALSAGSMEVHSFLWDKQYFSKWWSLQASTWAVPEQRSVSAKSIALEPVAGSKASFTILSNNASGQVAGDSWQIYMAAPSGRQEHIAVWTGTEMIIWGGYGVYTGRRYDPATDSWTPMSGSSSPGQSDSTVVWTGTEMIVWGGEYSAEGGRYNPATDSWASVSEIDAHQHFMGHTAIWTGSKMLVWGGRTNNSGMQDTDTGALYDPSTDTWTSTSTVDAPAPRSYHTAIWTGSEMVVWGGYYDYRQINYPYTSEQYVYQSGGRYDPSTDTWISTSTANVPDARQRHTAVWTGNEMVVWGGAGVDDDAPGFSTGGRYNPLTNTWSATSLTNVPMQRSGHTAIWSGSEMIIWGGRSNNEEGGYTDENSGGRYNPTSNSWQATTAIGAPSGRNSYTAVWTGSEMIVWGGWSTGTLENTGGRYNPVTDSWIPTFTLGSDVPHGRKLHTAVWTGNEMIVWGGYSYPDVFDSGGRYDPVLNNWLPTNVTGAPLGRYSHTAIWTGSEMIIWGGKENSYLSTGGRYDPTSDSWLPTSTTGVPAGRYEHVAVWTGSRMIVYGGYKQNYLLNDGGMYDPFTDSWLLTNTTGAPYPVELRTAVWTGSEMVVWGGQRYNGITNVFYNTGGRYNPETNSWMATSTVGAPVGRWKHSVVWTGNEMIVWGGRGVGYTAFNDGGKYDPDSDTWLPVSTTAAPSARYYHTAVWTGSEMIVWGGDSSYHNNGGRYAPSQDSWQSTSTADPLLVQEQNTVVWTGVEMILWGGHWSASRYTNDMGIYYPYSTHTIGGSVAGLGTGKSLVLQSNGTDDIVITENGSFTFSRALVNGASYNVTVLTQPETTDRYCGVPNGSGNVDGANITDANVNCVTLSLKDTIVALQALAGMHPEAADLSTLLDIAADGKISMVEVIVVLQNLD